MESIHKNTGKKFTGRFAELAVKIGLAHEVKELTEEELAKIEEEKKLLKEKKEAEKKAKAEAKKLKAEKKAKK